MCRLLCRVVIFGIVVGWLLPTIVSAQTWVMQSPPIMFGFDVRPIFSKQTAEFRDEAFTITSSSTRVELSGIAIMPDRLRFRYTATPGFGASETIVPSGSLVIGTTEFGQKSQTGQAQTQQTQQQDQKPVDIEITRATEHRMEVGGLFRDLPVQPMITTEWVDFTVKGTGEKDGQVVSASEQFKKTFWGVGGVFYYATPQTRAEILFVGSDKFSRFEGTILYRIMRDAAVAGGYMYETKRFDGFKVRTAGPFVGLTVAF